MNQNHDNLPPLPEGFSVMMTPNPDGTPAIWYDENDMRAYALAALAAQPSREVVAEPDDPLWEDEVLELAREFGSCSYEIGGRMDCVRFTTDKLLAFVAALTTTPQPEALATDAEVEPSELGKLLTSFERCANRFGELWERCQGKGWPEPESSEFNRLRDERMPELRQQILALAATQARAAAEVPDGYVIVPAEATEAMCRAAVILANGNAVYKNVAAGVLKIEESIYGEAYAAMLAAAPPAPAAEVRDGWLPIETAPVDELVIVFWNDPNDNDTPERYDFDWIEDGVWQQHSDNQEHYLVVGGPSLGPGPGEKPPYTHWKRLGIPAAPAASRGDAA